MTEAEERLVTVPREHTGITVGFVGTSAPMTSIQLERVRDLMKGLRPLFAHHATSAGSAAEFNAIAKKLEVLTVGCGVLDEEPANGLQLDWRFPPLEIHNWVTRLCQRSHHIIAAPTTRAGIDERTAVALVIAQAIHVGREITAVFSDGSITKL